MNLIHYFWGCGDNQIIEFSLMRAHLNKREREVIHCILDECMTQEETSEYLGYSTRWVQETWYSATQKLLNIPWVKAYADTLKP